MLFNMSALDKEMLIKAASDAIKVYRYEPINEQYKKIGSLDTTLETLLSERFDPGYIYIIQNICCWAQGTGTPQIKIGIYDGVTKFPYIVRTIANAEDSAEYIGQLIVIEGRKVYVDFENAVAGDTAYLNINGYRIKK